MLSEITILVEGGHGGDGSVSFRRERYVPRGGPDGGNGGDGGSVIVRAIESWRGLEELRAKRVARADPGGNGAGAKKHGRRANDVTLVVPVGTLVWAERQGVWEELADLREPNDDVVVAKGGDGGKGNATFVSSTNQAPKIAERGLPGDRRRIRLELRLLADVGLVGLPNAGKSSLLGAMTSAEAHVANYAFTTLEPQLGVVEVGHERFVMADIPGLIEGASEGRGLGSDFLQQIERTGALLFVLDGSGVDPYDNLRQLIAEITAYGRGLAEKRRVVIVSKRDLVTEESVKDLISRLRGDGYEAYATSAKLGSGINELASALLQAVRDGRSNAKDLEREALLRPQQQEVIVEKVGEAYRLLGAGPERAALRLGTASAEARRELWRRLTRMGATAALRKAGARSGDHVSIGSVELELLE